MHKTKEVATRAPLQTESEQYVGLWDFALLSFHYNTLNSHI